MKSPICALMLFSIALTAAAQTRVPPPPKPGQSAQSQSGPSLEVTMQFISDKLNDIGKVNYVDFMHNTNDGTDSTVNAAHEFTNISASAQACHIGFHLRDWLNGTIKQDLDAGFNLKDVEDVVVEPMEKYLSQVDADAGVPNMLVTSTSPHLTALLVRRPHNLINFFPIADDTVADRLAKALTHAVELCGGGAKKEPF